MKKLWTVVTATVLLAVPAGLLPGGEPNTPRHEPQRGERTEPRARMIDWFSVGRGDVSDFETPTNAPLRTPKGMKSALWDRADKEREGTSPINTVSNAPTAPHWASLGVRTAQCHRGNEPVR